MPLTVTPHSPRWVVFTSELHGLVCGTSNTDLANDLGHAATGGRKSGKNSTPQVHMVLVSPAQGMHRERVHPASASIIQSCDSPKLGTCECVRTAKKLIFESNKFEKVHLIAVWHAVVCRAKHCSCHVKLYVTGYHFCGVCTGLYFTRLLTLLFDVDSSAVPYCDHLLHDTSTGSWSTSDLICQA
jgi:hypothetical protein